MANPTICQSNTADVHNIIGQVAKDYQYKDVFSPPEWLISLWNNIKRFILDLILKLLSKLPGVHLDKPESIGKTAVIVLVVLILIGVICLVIWRQKYLKRINAAAITSTSAEEKLHTASQWKEQAFTYKNEGKLRNACRALHRSSLQLLDEAKILTFVPARANFEYALALSTKPAMQAIFKTFSAKVDAIYFGHREASETDFQFCLDCWQKIENEIVIKSTKHYEKK